MSSLSPRPARIALFLPHLEGGGAERITVYLAEGFAEQGIETDLVLVKAGGSYLSQVSSRVNIIDLDAPRAILSVGKLAGYLRAARPDALISALNYTNLVALAAGGLSGYGGKSIITLHNQFDVPKAAPPRFKERMAMRLMRSLYPRADDIVAVSHGVADDAAACLGLERDKLRVIYNPVISDAVLAKAEAASDDDWLNDSGPPVAIAIGRLHEQKDFPNLLHAFRRVRSELDCRLIILGEGADRAKLEALTRTLQLEHSVRLPGFVANPYAYLRQADVFVLSSRWEGLPTVLIEALALGKRIVSTNCKSGPEEILLDGRYGALVPIGDDEALARALCDAFRRTTPEFDPVEASRRFTYERSVRSYLDLALSPLSVKPSETPPCGPHRYPSCDVGTSHRRAWLDGENLKD